MSKKIKIFAIVTLVLAAIIGGVTFFSSSNTSNSQSSGIISSSAAAKVAGVPQTTVSTTSEFSSVLSSITSISLDTTLLKNPAYLALRDYPITLGSDFRGRPNPFAPVGYDVGTIGAGQATSLDIQFETLQPAKVTATTAEVGAQAVVSTTDQSVIIFEYGTSDVLGSATAPVTLGKNGTALFRLTGLTPNTTYYIRAVFTQGSITKTGNMMTFTTLKK